MMYPIFPFSVQRVAMLYFFTHTLEKSMDCKILNVLVPDFGLVYKNFKEENLIFTFLTFDFFT